MFRTSFFLSGADPFLLRGETAGREIRRLHAPVRGYLQTRATAEQIADAPPAYDGVAELWFDTPEAAHIASKAAYPLQGLIRPGVNIAKRSVGMERPVMLLPSFRRGAGIKGVFPFGKKKGQRVEDFQTHWWHRHGPIAALTEGASAYIQCHPMPFLYSVVDPAFDGITEIWWPDVATARTAMKSRQMTEDQSNDAKNFAEPGSVQLFLAAEEVVIAP
jgi:uncharacterized protein (TIGR02118 family)